MLLDHRQGILNYRRTKVSMEVVEAVNGNIESLLRGGGGIGGGEDCLFFALRRHECRRGTPGGVRYKAGRGSFWVAKPTIAPRMLPGSIISK
jgi:hypothetical protein